MNFQKWKTYFQQNSNHFDHLNWSDLPVLSATEKCLITSSIQQFQRGEHSEGKHFLQYAESLNDKTYIDAVKLFIREEQDHAMVLGRFMDGEAIEKIKRDGLDNIFRLLRKLAGLEGTVTVLLTAEIISMIYYRALAKATSSGLLQSICKQILVDEEMHLRFQSNTLKKIYASKIGISILVSNIIHRLLMAGTILMVWVFHRRVLKAGGFNCISFFIEVWHVFLHCKKMIAGKANMRPVINKDFVAP